MKLTGFADENNLIFHTEEKVHQIKKYLDGDGHVEEIVADLKASGFDGFYSLEPHLFRFKGFEQLEREGISRSGSTGTEMDEITAFGVAYRAFRKLQ